MVIGSKLLPTQKEKYLDVNYTPVMEVKVDQYDEINFSRAKFHEKVHRICGIRSYFFLSDTEKAHRSIDNLLTYHQNNL